MESETSGMQAEHQQDRNPLSEIYDWAEAIVFSLTAVILVFTFIFRIVGVGGVSMENTLNAGVINENDYVDRVVISHIHYTPAHGDIVVLYAKALKECIIKRVIAVGGDTVNIDFDHHLVYVNGKALTEPYIREPTIERGDVQFPITVPKGHVFVMGDNRNDSYDSRYKAVGMIDDQDILGHAILRIYPLNQIEIL